MTRACSISTLGRALREHFVVCLKRYLTCVCLCGTRKVLLNPKDTRAIADVATDWGVWYLSKYASDYCTLFGELSFATRFKVARDDAGDTSS